jgi:hypothetical protein
LSVVREADLVCRRIRRRRHTLDSAAREVCPEVGELQSDACYVVSHASSAGVDAVTLRVGGREYEIGAAGRVVCTPESEAELRAAGATALVMRIDEPSSAPSAFTTLALVRVSNPPPPPRPPPPAVFPPPYPPAALPPYPPPAPFIFQSGQDTNFQGGLATDAPLRASRSRPPLVLAIIAATFGLWLMTLSQPSAI